MPEYSNYLESLDPVVGALSGDEIIGASKDGDAVSLTAQQIADLGGGGGTWGSITGTLSNQTDLQTALDARQLLVNTAVAITDAASMDLTAIKHTLTTSSATRTFTISYTGDDITLIVTLNTTATVFTFPATSLCVSEGVSSGNNTCSLAGVSGDKYAIAIKKVGSDYYVVAKNFGQ